MLQATTGRLYPSAMQAKAMARIGGQCRALWNHWLAVNAERYAAEGKFAFYKEMSAALPFKIVGLNWIVERTFAWLSRNRRRACLKGMRSIKDYEYRVQTSETLIPIAAVRLMLSRLVGS